MQLLGDEVLIDRMRIRFPTHLEKFVDDELKQVAALDPPRFLAERRTMFWIALQLIPRLQRVCEDCWLDEWGLGSVMFGDRWTMAVGYDGEYASAMPFSGWRDTSPVGEVLNGMRELLCVATTGDCFSFSHYEWPNPEQFSPRELPYELLVRFLSKTTLDISTEENGEEYCLKTIWEGIASTIDFSGGYPLLYPSFRPERRSRWTLRG